MVEEVHTEQARPPTQAAMENIDNFMMGPACAQFYINGLLLMGGPNHGEYLRKIMELEEEFGD